MTDITIENVTNITDENANNGTGVFDVLMKSVEAHIESQYGKITGSDYATVYLGSLQAVLAQSVQFVLQEEAAGLQADLIAEQIAASQARTIREDGIAAADVALKNAQELDVEYVTLNHRPQQTEVLIEQIDLLQSQDQVEVERFSTQQKITDKTQSEIELLDQKYLTELAQTSDTDGVKYGTGGTALTGILGAQVNLYNHQSAGFKAKHHVDTVKQLSDMWSVAYAITDGASPNLPVALTSVGGGAGTDLDTEISDMKTAFDSL